MSVTTVGYGDHATLSDSSKLALSAFLVIGVGFVGAGIGIIGEALLDKVDGDNTVSTTFVRFGIRWTPAKKKLGFSALTFLFVLTFGVVGFMLIEPLTVDPVTNETSGYTFVDAYWSAVVTARFFLAERAAPTNLCDPSRRHRPRSPV